jgi:hypothetical protein
MIFTYFTIRSLPPDPGEAPRDGDGMDKERLHGIAFNLAFGLGRLFVAGACFAMAVVYTWLFVHTILKDHWSGLFVGFGGVPFRNPMLRVLLAIPFIAQAAALGLWRLHALKARLKPLPGLALALIVTVLCGGLVHLSAVFGYSMGFMFGSRIGSLTLALMVLCVAGGVVIFPRREAWRKGLAGEGEEPAA